MPAAAASGSTSTQVHASWPSCSACCAIRAVFSTGSRRWASVTRDDARHLWPRRSDRARFGARARHAQALPLCRLRGGSNSMFRWNRKATVTRASRILFREAAQSASIIGRVLAALPAGPDRSARSLCAPGHALAAVEAPSAQRFTGCDSSEDGTRRALPDRRRPPSPTGMASISLRRISRSRISRSSSLASASRKPSATARSPRWRLGLKGCAPASSRAVIRTGPMTPPGFRPAARWRRPRCRCGGRTGGALPDGSDHARRTARSRSITGRCVHCLRCLATRTAPSELGAGYEWAATADERGGAAQKLGRRFGRSLHVRFVDAGACGACMSEARQLNNPYYNMHRLGILPDADAAQRRHAAGRGPVTDAMRLPLRKTYEAMPTPKRVVAIGAVRAFRAACSGRASLRRGGVAEIIPVDVACRDVRRRRSRSCTDFWSWSNASRRSRSHRPLARRSARHDRGRDASRRVLRAVRCRRGGSRFLSRMSAIPPLLAVVGSLARCSSSWRRALPCSSRDRASIFEYWQILPLGAR